MLPSTPCQARCRVASNRSSRHRRLRLNLSAYKSEPSIAWQRSEPSIVKINGRIGCSAPCQAPPLASPDRGICVEHVQLDNNLVFLTQTWHSDKGMRSVSNMFSRTSLLDLDVHWIFIMCMERCKTISKAPFKLEFKNYAIRILDIPGVTVSWKQYFDGSDTQRQIAAPATVVESMWHGLFVKFARV